MEGNNSQDWPHEGVWSFAGNNFHLFIIFPLHGTEYESDSYCATALKSS